MIKARVSLVFTHMLTEEKACVWPYEGYDYKKREEQISQRLKMDCPDIKFIPATVHKPEQVESLVKKSKDIDGYVVYMLGIWTGVGNAVAHSGHPTIFVDDLYGGSGELLTSLSNAKKERLPVVGIASSNFQDVTNTVKLFKVIRSMKEAKILDVIDAEQREGVTPLDSYVKSIFELFGTQVIKMSSDELISYYNATNENEAGKWADRWINEAEKVVEPPKDKIVKSAKMYLALKKATQDMELDAVTVDCLGLLYKGKLPAYPCLAFFQMNNDGLTGVCEADLDSTITQLLMRYLTSRPGYVSDPVIDTATNQIIYAHCVASNKVFGSIGPSNPYMIRSHCSDRNYRREASVQSLMPLGEMITTLKINVLAKAMSVHQGKTVANIKEERGCRTKLAVEVNAEKILDNWNKKANWGWHRVTFYGDWKKQVIRLATLLGIKVFEEDK